LIEVLRNPHGALYHGYFGEREKAYLYANDVELPSSAGLLEQIWRQCGSSDPKQVVTWVDMQMQLPEEFLMMTDRFSMAWSLEARPPLLDRELMEFVLSLPSKFRSPDRPLKSLLIDAVSDLLPEEVVAGPKKGFVIPVASWLRRELKPLVECYLGSEFLRQQGLFREDLYKSIALPHLTGSVDASSKIWTLLMFQLWWNRHIGNLH